MAENEIDSNRLRELHKFEKKIGVKFNNIEILNLALTHASYSHELGTNQNNERLEFLGDAVLELVSSSYLYKHFEGLSEGALTKTRANIVCQQSLSKLANRLNMGDFLLLGNSEAANRGRFRDSNLEDTFEAVIGAVYIDRGWEVAKEYVLRQLMPEFERVKAEGVRLDYKSTLQEYIQQFHRGKIVYVELSATGPDHMRTFECAVELNGKRLGTGIGKSKKLAEQEAAKVALRKYNFDV